MRVFRPADLSRIAFVVMIVLIVPLSGCTREAPAQVVLEAAQGYHISGDIDAAGRERYNVSAALTRVEGSVLTYDLSLRLAGNATEHVYDVKINHARTGPRLATGDALYVEFTYDPEQPTMRLLRFDLVHEPTDRALLNFTFTYHPPDK